MDADDHKAVGPVVVIEDLEVGDVRTQLTHRRSRSR